MKDAHRTPMKHIQLQSLNELPVTSISNVEYTTILGFGSDA
jgi:hypothetical protein